ncbi:MAG: TorF family putative porin [Balneolaceae bacterium]
MKISNKISTFIKSILLVLFGAVLISALNPETAKAQEVSTGVDLYSTYVFRGVAFAGPSIQPFVEFSSGGFAIGAWGSQGVDGIVSGTGYSNGFQEMDLYAGYSFDSGLSLGITDYYYPGSLYLEGDSHAFEINAGYGIADFSLAANMIINEAASAGSAGNDLYFEAGYSIGGADLFLGAGDGWHSTDGDFALVNVGIGTSKDIVITDTFTIPLTGAVVFNPNSEQLFILAGVSF